MPPIYILRHGQTVWNLEGRMQGSRDSPLTDLGQAQAARQGAILGRIGLPCGTEFRVSPLGRTQQTARHALAGLTEGFATDDRLRELSVGQCEGLTHPEIEDRFPGLIDPGKPLEWYFQCPGGESMASIRARVAELLGAVTGPTVLVTHGITSRFLRAALLDADWRDLGAPDGGQGVVYELRGGLQIRHAEDQAPQTP